jgi:hypothetical protein
VFVLFFVLGFCLCMRAVTSALALTHTLTQHQFYSCKKKQDLESISAKCEIPPALQEEFVTYSESFRGELVAYMNKERKLRRRLQLSNSKTKKKRRKLKQKAQSGVDPDWLELSRIDGVLARDIDFCFALTSQKNGGKTAQDCLPDGVVCHFGHACAFVSPTTKQQCFNDPICGDLYLCVECSISLCSVHRRCHAPEHELVLRQRQSADSKELGLQPATVLKWSVLDVLDHEPDAKRPADITRMKFLINWAGPFKHEWCTLKELGFTLKTELVAAYLRNNKIVADRLRLPNNEVTFSFALCVVFFFGGGRGGLCVWVAHKPPPHRLKPHITSHQFCTRACLCMCTQPKTFAHTHSHT